MVNRGQAPFTNFQHFDIVPQRVKGQVPESFIPCEYLILRIGLELIWGDVGI